MARPFLTAEWRRLLILSDRVDPALVQPLCPPGTEPDLRAGEAYASLVGFWFERTRVRGVAVPFHTRFAEVNLRFYVRRRGPDGWRRGVVFAKEIVPRRAVALVARALYNERYVALPMRTSPDTERRLEPGARVRYQFRERGRWSSFEARAEAELQAPGAGSLEEFVSGVEWGYVRRRNGGTLEYRVEHPRWSVAAAGAVAVDVDMAGVYGAGWAGSFAVPRVSALLVEGSGVRVFPGERVA